LLVKFIRQNWFMRSQSYSLSVPGSRIAATVQKYCIPPTERLKFAVLFVLATGFGSFLVRFVLHTLQHPIVPTFWQTSGLIGAFISGLVSGTLVGATQWFVLRRYLPDWLWMLATTAGYVILMPILHTWQRILVEQMMPLMAGLFWFDALPSPVVLAVQSIIGIGLAAICSVWLGFMQWLVLRQYAKPSWGWIYVPSIAVLLAGALLLVRRVIPLLTTLPLAMEVFTPGIIGATQAIACCALYRRISPAGAAPSLLTIAPEILNRRQLQPLTRQLYAQLSQAWTTELEIDRPLNYLVGVNSAGTIVDYEPQHILATEQIGQTPLPILADTTGYLHNARNPQPLARFQVSFLPAGQLQVRSYRGLSLLELASLLLGLVTVASAIANYLGANLP
jgi:hypothetical protein